MKQLRHEHLIAFLIILAGVVGAATIWTIPALFNAQNEASVWITVALGCVFLALAAVARQERRKHVSRRR